MARWIDDLTGRAESGNIKRGEKVDYKPLSGGEVAVGQGGEGGRRGGAWQRGG